MTQRPMSKPNSRSGCKELNKFAKKQTDVVSDVARQLFPAFHIVHTIRSRVVSNEPLLWIQKLTKTKMTSISMIVIKKTGDKDARVAFSAGLKTKAIATEENRMKKQAALRKMLFM
mmetsp:Transcript_45674/g.80319  ORF Transcript_45674/g.80319 Transcript_45674/m.80319 type:complete len:116 (+) Transcript_45674:97-444(+)